VKKRGRTFLTIDRKLRSVEAKESQNDKEDATSSAVGSGTDGNIARAKHGPTWLTENRKLRSAQGKENPLDTLKLDFHHPDGDVDITVTLIKYGTTKFKVASVRRANDEPRPFGSELFLRLNAHNGCIFNAECLVSLLRKFVQEAERTVDVGIQLADLDEDEPSEGCMCLLHKKVRPDERFGTVPNWNVCWFVCAQFVGTGLKWEPMANDSCGCVSDFFGTDFSRYC
jgi:hypothetical protein